MDVGRGRTVVVASHNPVKIAATRRGFERMFPGIVVHLRAVAVSSGVRAQPLSDAETLRGALTRAQCAAQLVPQADYWVGLEGGVEDRQDSMEAFAWVVVYTPQLVGKSRTGTFGIPAEVAALLRQGQELGAAVETLYGQARVKQTTGAVGVLTGGALDRVQLYEQAVVLALVPFKHVQRAMASGAGRGHRL